MKNSIKKKLMILVGISVSILILDKSNLAKSPYLKEKSPKEATIEPDSTSNHTAYQLFVYGVPGWQLIQSIKLK